MSDTLPPSSSADAATTSVSAQAAGGADHLPPLTVGALDVAHKEQLVLRSLVRMLDSHYGLRLRYAEDLAHCNVVFVSEVGTYRMPERCVTVRVTSAGQHSTTAAAFGLAVPAPLRMTNVIEVLRLAANVLAQSEEGGIAGLFRRLSRMVLDGERRQLVLPLLDGRCLLVDMAAQTIWSPLSHVELLADDYCVGDAYRASPQQLASFAQSTSLRLRDFLWIASYHLGQNGAPGSRLAGSFWLRRWPDALVLSRPGFPQLCALLTSRAMTLPQASAASGLSLPAVQWFMECGVALGIAQPMATPHTTPAQSPALPSANLPPAAHGLRSVFGRLRERLKLW